MTHDETRPSIRHDMQDRQAKAFPPDYRLTEREVLAMINDYAQERGSDRKRVLELVAMVGGIRPIRDKYSKFGQEVEEARAAEVEASTPVGIPDVIAKFLATRPQTLFTVQRAAIAWAQPLRGPSPNMRHLGLLICGTQLGKSCAAAMTITPGYVTVGRNRRYFIAESELIRNLMQTRDRDASMSRYRNVQTLVVDHLGSSITHGAKGFREVVEFLRMRWEAGNRNVLTTRLSGRDELIKNYGLDAWATFERYCTIVQTQARNEG